jgi:hypothetical protein
MTTATAGKTTSKSPGMIPGFAHLAMGVAKREREASISRPC